MFDTINGIPLHPLVVHGVVVLLPLAILGTIAIAVRPSWRRSYGILVVAVAAIATVLVPVATQTGEKFQEHVGSAGEHAEMGDQLLWFALPLLVLAAALVFLDRREAPVASEAVATGSTLVKTVAVLSVVAALATGFQVYRVGDSGARAAWCDKGQFDCKTVQ